MFKMNYASTIILLINIGTHVNATNIPSRLDLVRSGGGPDGYKTVSQQWTGPESGKLTCEGGGLIKCSWYYKGSLAYPVDFNEYAYEILVANQNGGSSTGTYNVNGFVFTYSVLHNNGGGDGHVVFLILNS
jgi:hypothetical protein